MLRKLVMLLTAGLLTLSLSVPALAEQVMGTISKVGEEGREITVKDKAGKEVDVKISGSRTKIEGVKSRSELKEGQSVTIEHEKGEPKNIKIAK